MSRYQQLIDAVEALRRRHRDRHNDAVRFTSELMSAFKASLEIPSTISNPLQYRPVLGEEREGAEYTLPGALRTDDEGRYHVGVLFTIHVPGGARAERLMFHLVLTWMADSRYEVQFADALPKVLVELARAETLTAFTDAIFQSLLRHYSLDGAEGTFASVPPEERN